MTRNTSCTVWHPGLASLLLLIDQRGLGQRFRYAGEEKICAACAFLSSDAPVLRRRFVHEGQNEVTHRTPVRVFSLTPVWAITPSKIWQIEGPWVPRRRASHTQITSAAMRSCWLAGPVGSNRQPRVKRRAVRLEVRDIPYRTTYSARPSVLFDPALRRSTS